MTDQDRKLIPGTRLSMSLSHEANNLDVQRTALHLLAQLMADNPHLALIAEFGWTQVGYTHGYVRDGVIAPTGWGTPVWIKESRPGCCVEIIIEMERKPLLLDLLIDAGFTEKEPSLSPSLRTYYERFTNPDWEDEPHDVEVRFWKRVKVGDEVYGCTITEQETTSWQMELSCPTEKGNDR